MKKNWLRGAAAILALTVVAGCGSSGDDENSSASAGASLPVPTFPAGSTAATIQQKGRLIAGVKFDQNGFGLKNPVTNKIEGFDVQIAELLAQGIFGGTKAEAAGKIDYVETVSKNREPFIRDGKTDVVVATYTINDTRKQLVDFAGPYYIAHGDVLVKQDDNAIKTITDLNGKNVCTVQGSTYPANIKAKAPQANVTLFDQYTQCAEALKDGRVVAMTTDAPILAGISQSNPGQFKLINANYTDEPYGIGIKKGDDVFRSWINDRLDTIYKNGDWKKAYDDTLGKLGLPTPTPPPVDRYGMPVPTTAAQGSPTTSGGATPTTAASGSGTTTAPVNATAAPVTATTIGSSTIATAGDITTSTVKY